MTTKNNVANMIITVLKASKSLLSAEEIHKLTGLSRDTVRNNLSLLLETNPSVEVCHDGKRKKYYYRDPETLFGIPVPDEVKQRIDGIMAAIYMKAREKGINIHRTAMQKILWKLNKEFSLDMPFVRYRFGLMCAYRPLKEMSQGGMKIFGIDDMIEKRIGELVEEAKGKTREEIARKQYDEEGMDEFKFIMGIREGLRNGEMEKIAMNSLKLSRYLLSVGMEKEAGLVMDIPYYLELVTGRGSLEDIRELFEKVVKFIGIGLVEKDLVKRYGFDRRYAELLVERKRAEVMEDIRELVADIEAKYPPKVGRETEKTFEEIDRLVNDAKKRSRGG